MHGDCTLPYNLGPVNHDLPRSLFLSRATKEVKYGVYFFPSMTGLHILKSLGCQCFF